MTKDCKHKYQMECQKIQQIYMNLLQNAIKFAFKQSLITVQISVNDDNTGDKDSSIVKVKLINSGPEINQERIRAILDPQKKYKDLDSSFLFQGVGTGFGLQLCKRICDQFGW